MLYRKQIQGRGAACGEGEDCARDVPSKIRQLSGTLNNEKEHGESGEGCSWVGEEGEYEDSEVGR